MLIDPSVINARLRIAIEQLFQVSNQTSYISLIHTTSEPLTRCMSTRIHSCIGELSQIVKEIEPRVINTRCLTLEDALILEGYAEIRRGLIKSWQFIESREQAIIQQTENRILKQGRDGQ
jgi:hypothetical protein